MKQGVVCHLLGVLSELVSLLTRQSSLRPNLRERVVQFALNVS